MLKRRLIPKLQMKPARLSAIERMVLVTTRQFSNDLEIGNPVSQAKIYQAQMADELIFLDLDPAGHSRESLLRVIGQATEEIFMPFTVGGGIRSIEDIRQVLRNGADKVSINTTAVKSPEFIERASDMFGSQCIVLSIDYRMEDDGACRVWIDGGRTRTGLEAVEWAAEGERRGAGEILLTSIDRDGTRAGLDLELTRRVAERVFIPVITSGGCGLASHFTEGFLKGKADAVAAGTYFCFKDENPMQTRAQISNGGVAIRLHT